MPSVEGALDFIPGTHKLEHRRIRSSRTYHIQRKQLKTRLIQREWGGSRERGGRGIGGRKGGRGKVRGRKRENFNRIVRKDTG